MKNISNPSAGGNQTSHENERHQSGRKKISGGGYQRSGSGDVKIENRRRPGSGRRHLAASAMVKTRAGEIVASGGNIKEIEGVIGGRRHLAQIGRKSVASRARQQSLIGEKCGV
jgi:hypothetical protein